MENMKDLSKEEALPINSTKKRVIRLLLGMTRAAIAVYQNDNPHSLPPPRSPSSSPSSSQASPIVETKNSIAPSQQEISNREELNNIIKKIVRSECNNVKQTGGKKKHTKRSKHSKRYKHSKRCKKNKKKHKTQRHKKNCKGKRD